MDVKTFRASTMRQALDMVRQELGPDAAVLHTRQVRGGMLSWLVGKHKRIEVVASSNVNVPSRLPASRPSAVAEQMIHYQAASSFPQETQTNPVAFPTSTKSAFEHPAVQQEDLKGQIESLYSMVEDLRHQTNRAPGRDMPESMFKLFTDLIEAEVSEDLARELVGRVQRESVGKDLLDSMLTKARIARMIEDEIKTTGPIRSTPGTRRIVALVGPTGVGKTTTIAKLAANYRLREKLRVGLITVDTYRIAAVEQMRTYADIMDLRMEVVSTPKEMREALARLSETDLVFMDTAGRSPKDNVRIQELKSVLAEANADEIHLVLSSVASAASLTRTTKQFSVVGTTGLILTKLDEATGLGNLLPLLRGSQLPLSYLTDGQNVPDDIQIADARKLARIVLGMEE